MIRTAIFTVIGAMVLGAGAAQADFIAIGGPNNVIPKSTASMGTVGGFGVENVQDGYISTNASDSTAIFNTDWGWSQIIFDFDKPYTLTEVGAYVISQGTADRGTKWVQFTLYNAAGQAIMPSHQVANNELVQVDGTPWFLGSWVFDAPVADVTRLIVFVAPAADSGAWQPRVGEVVAMEVPEPASLSLLGLAGATLMLRRKH